MRLLICLTNNVSPCKYYEIDNLPIKNLNSVDIIHISIRSLQKNFDSLQEFLCLLPKIPEIICLTESRINKDSSINIELPDFKLFRNDSVTRAGGVAVYVADTLNVEIISSLYLDITGCENIWLKMNCLNIVFGVIYRHPSNNAKLFLEQLNKNLELLNNAKLYLIGDSNINICSPNKNFSNDAIDYVNMLASNSFFPIISLPTRVTDTSATLIDHIITNDCKNSIFPGIIKTDLFDHYLIFCTIDAAARNSTSNNKS